MNLDFANLPPHLRRAIIAGVALIVAVAAVAFVTSFKAQADWAAKNGMELTWALPVMVDLGLLAGELCLVVCAGVNYSRFIPLVWIAGCSAASIAFNVKHADPGFWPGLTAAVAPIITIGVSILVATLIKAIAQGLGKPLTYAPAPGPVTGLLGPVPGTIYRPDHPAIGYVPGSAAGYGYGQPYPPVASPYMLPAAYAQLPSPGGQPGANAQEQLLTPGANPQEHLSTNGQPGRAGDDGQPSTYGLAAREVIDYLDGLADRGQLNAAVTARQVAEDTGAHYNTVRPILADYKRMLGIPTGRNARHVRNGTEPDRAADA